MVYMYILHCYYYVYRGYVYLVCAVWCCRRHRLLGGGDLFLWCCGERLGSSHRQLQDSRQTYVQYGVCLVHYGYLILSSTHSFQLYCVRLKKTRLVLYCLLLTRKRSLFNKIYCTCKLWRSISTDSVNIFIAYKYITKDQALVIPNFPKKSILNVASIYITKTCFF